ncbi:MAG TPA: response regulator [Anaerolineales bacterium]|jgi:CheY-like chemotaxis protein
MKKVMIVDDNRTMVSLLRTLFELQGYEVLTALDRDTLLANLRSERPEVVLMDVFLSGLDGLDLLRQIRAAQDLAGVRVVMTSGMDLAESCLQAGADAFLLKPYTPDQLFETVERNLPAEGAAAREGV